MPYIVRTNLQFFSLLFYFIMILLPPRSTLFPYTTLFRSDRMSRRTSAPNWPATSAAAAIAGSPAPPSARRREWWRRSEEHTSELQSQFHLVCRLLLEKKKESLTGNYQSLDLLNYQTLHVI